MSTISFPQAGASLHKPPQVIHRPGSRDSFASEAASWGPIRAGAALRTFAQFLFLSADTRSDVVGAFARRARSDANFPTDPTVVIRYLTTQLAPDEVLDAALQTVEAFREWEAEGLELALRDLAWTNQARADALRKSLERSQAALEELYAQDAALADVRASAEAGEDDQDQERDRSRNGKRGKGRRGRSR